MYSQAFYNQNSNLVNISKYQIKKWDQACAQRFVAKNILCMLLGLSSQLFRQINHHYLKPQSIKLHNLSQETLSSFLQSFIQVGNQLMYIRTNCQRLSHMSNSILRAFSEGIHEYLYRLNQRMTLILKNIQKQAGEISRTFNQMQDSKREPITLLQLSTKISQQKDEISNVVSIISRLALPDNPSQQDLQQSGVLLLNIYYEQLERQNLQKRSTVFHQLIGRCLISYLNICENWLSCKEGQLAALADSGFFIDIQRHLEEQLQKKLQTKGLIIKQKIPLLFQPFYKRIFQIGKTSQFIKLYFDSSQLYQNEQHFNTNQEIKTIMDFIQMLFHKKVQLFSKINRKIPSIGNRLKQKRKKDNQFLSQLNDPFWVGQKKTGFFQLRMSKEIYQNHKDYHSRHHQDQLIKNTQSSTIDKKYDLTYSGINTNLKFLIDDALKKIEFKYCKLSKNPRIKQSVERQLKNIKSFILLGQGDFVQQFLRNSQNLLSQSADRILKNTIDRTIQEAIKSCGLKDNLSQLSYLFLRAQQGGIKGWKTFSFTINPQRPTNALFTTKIIQQFCSVGNFLFNLRRCEFILIKIWTECHQLRGFLINKPRNAAHRFTVALMSYLFTQIQQVWTVLKEKSISYDSILDFQNFIEETLSNLKRITIQDKYLCNCLLALFKIVERLQIFINYKATDGEAKQSVQQIMGWLLSLYDQAKKIQKFATSFDMSTDFIL